MKEENKIGTYRKNQKGFGFVKLENQEDEIYIAKENSLNALNGDVVSIEIIAPQNKETDKKEEGKITKIIRHEKDTVVGTFQKNRNFGFVVPDDKNFGTDIFVSKEHWGKARNKHKVLVKITKVYLGKTKTLSVSGTIATVQWESRNKQVATVNDNGVVTGIEEGNAVIVAKIGKYKLYCDVTVEFDEESAKKNIEVKTWANYSYGEVYVEMTNHNDFPVVVNGSGKFYDVHDEPVYSFRARKGFCVPVRVIVFDAFELFISCRIFY